jgi:hypothetical protein
MEQEWERRRSRPTMTHGDSHNERIKLAYTTKNEWNANESF